MLFEEVIHLEKSFKFKLSNHKCSLTELILQ
jgi:hypothetical protein